MSHGFYRYIIPPHTTQAGRGGLGGEIWIISAFASVWISPQLFASPSPAALRKPAAVDFLVAARPARRDRRLSLFFGINHAQSGSYDVVPSCHRLHLFHRDTPRKVASSIIHPSLVRASVVSRYLQGKSTYATSACLRNVVYFPGLGLVSRCAHVTSCIRLSRAGPSRTSRQTQRRLVNSLSNRAIHPRWEKWI